MTIAQTITSAIAGKTTLYAAIGGAALLAAVIAGVQWYHHAGYEQGRADEKQAVLLAQQALTTAMQEEKDRADAQYRGAVLARQAVEAQVAGQTVAIAGLQEQVRSDAARITGLDGLLQQYRSRAKSSPAGGRSDGPGPDWIGLLGECVARVESLAGRVGSNASRLGQVAADAAGWADKVNGLQGYARGLQAAAGNRGR